MKRIFLILFINYSIFFSLNATTLNTSKVTAEFTAFKTAKKIGVNGTFKNIIFKFGKNKDSILSTLDGASATIDVTSLDLNDPAKEATLNTFFFSKFKKDKKGKQLIKVSFKNIIVGETQGTILATINMNGKTKKVPMQFTMNNQKLVAKGIINILDFGLTKEFESLAKECKDLHEGITWSEVAISFTAPIIK